MATPTTLPASFTAGQILTAAQMNNLRGAFRVLQVVSTTKTDLFTTTSATMVDVTGVSASITPSSSTSKVLVRIVFITGNNNASALNVFNLVRNSTNIGTATGGTTNNYTSHQYSNNANGAWSHSIEFLDSPNTTSATTYKLQMAAPNGGTGVIGRLALNDLTGGISTITVMEISA
jgi:hypothetical protein